MSAPIHILVLEDEQRAGEKLMKFIQEIVPFPLITWKRSVAEGIAYLHTQPTLDLIFSDIELLDGNAFQIFEAVSPPCPIIFCTAYNQFYIEAFQTNGIAYLLKPYTKAQLQEAWIKYQRLFQQEASPELSVEIINKLQNLITPAAQNYKQRFSVKKRNGVYLLATKEIAYFQAQGDFVLAIDQKNTKHILNYSLTAIEGVVNASHFFQINRSEIVNINMILKYESYTKNRLAISLTKPAIILYTSNSRSADFKLWIEG